MVLIGTLSFPSIQDGKTTNTLFGGYMTDIEIIAEAKKHKEVQRLEKKDAELKEQLKHMPDRYVHKKAELQEQHKEIRKEIREKRNDFTGLVQIAADTQGKVRHAANAAAMAAKKAVQDSAVTTVTGKTKDVNKITNPKRQNEISEGIIAEAKKRQSVQRLEKKDAELKERIKNTPDRHIHKKAELQEQHREIRKEIRAKRKDFTGLVQISANTRGKVQHATNAAAVAAKKAVKDSTVTTITGRTKDIAKITSSNKGRKALPSGNGKKK